MTESFDDLFIDFGRTTPQMKLHQQVEQFLPAGMFLSRKNLTDHKVNLSDQFPLQCTTRWLVDPSLSRHCLFPSPFMLPHFTYPVRKRLSNTPVPGKRFVLKFPDELRTEGFTTQTTYTRGSSGVSGRVCEQRYAAERVLPQSTVELRYAESAPEGATLEEKEPSSFFGRPVGAGGVGCQKIAEAARTELWAGHGAAGRASDRRTS